MKRLSVLILFLLFAGLLYIAENDAVPYSGSISQDITPYINGILKSENSKVNDVADYKIDVQLFPSQKYISASETITWKNKTDFPTNEIQFHLYPNAYKSNKTLFANGYNISNPDAQTEVKIKKFAVDGIEKELVYFQPEVPNPHDSTVAKVTLDKMINPGDSVKIHFNYSMAIPRSVKRMGYATGRNFFFVSQWFPKVGVFEDGRWICSQYYPYLNFYSDFGKYNVNIKVPSNYIVASTGVVKQKKIIGDSVVFNVYQNGVHDFAWLATDNILHRNGIYKRKDGTQILIQAYVQPEREKYFDRYFRTVKNCLQYFEDNIGIYPYQTISLIDVPRTCGSGGMEYPTLFTVSADLFSPRATGWPEYLVAHEFSHQFFYGLLANNEVYEAWLDEGFTSYITAKIMYKYNPDILAFFRFAKYVPVYGMNFLSYKEIPIIYTMSEIDIPEGANRVLNYYRNSTIGSIADTSCKLPTRLSYVVNSYDKPELVLLTLERYLGHTKMVEILKDYYDKFKYKHPKGIDFIKIVQSHCQENIDWFFKEYYFNAKIFNYSISGIDKISNDEYAVTAERLGDGYFKNDIYLYTEQDTLKQRWNSNERWKVFTFKTNNKVIGAEIDPQRKNLLDINFADNSYTMERRTWASLSISIRWFFWVQNALMILGSIG